MVWHTSKSKEKYAVRFLEYVNKLKEKKILFDCAVKVGEKEIPAHSLLLAANSESLREEILGGKENIVFEDVKLEVVEQCVDFMYGQHGDELEDNIEDILQVSSKIKFNGVTDLCFDYMEENLTVQNCFTIIEHAKSHGRNKVVASVKKFISENLKALIETEKFILLSKVDLLHYIEISNAECQVVWRAVLKWIEGKEEDGLLLELMNAVNVKEFPIEYLIQTVWKDAKVQDSAKVMVIQCVFSDLERLKRDINLDNYFLIKSFNESHNTFNKFAVKDIVESFMAEHFSQIKDKDDFMLLNSEDVVGILRAAKLAPVTEKWEAAVKWTKHDMSRAGYFLQLVKMIDVEVFTFNQLLDIVWEESLTQKSERVKEFVARILFSKKRELKEYVSIANWFHLMDVNIKYNSTNCEELDVFLKNFLAKNFGEISQKEDFLLLPKDDVLHILKIADINGVTNWQAMARWMKFDASREDHLLEVMEIMDFEDFSLDFLLQIVYNESLVQKSEIAKMRVVENLLSDVCRFEESINEDNCLDLKHLVDESSKEKHDDARKVVNRYIMLNLERVGSKRGFLDLSFNGLISLFQAPEGVIQSDETKWENVLKWVKHQRNRGALLSKLMEILRIQDFFLLFETVWRENLVQFSAEAKILVINGLFSDLETLRENIDVNNCFHLRELNACDHANKDEVGKLLSHFMMQHFEEIMGKEGFLNLSEDDLTMFLESPDTKISSEEVKWEAMVKWAKHDEQREAVFSRLFKLLDLKRIDGEYLLSFVLNKPLVKESQEFVSRLVHCLENRPQCVAILGTVTSKLMILDLEDGSSCRVSISENPSVGIVTIDREVYTVTSKEILQLHNDGTRTVLQQLRNVNCFSMVVSLHKKIYIIQLRERIMLCFDPADKSFIDNLAGCGLGVGFCAAAADDFIYAMGGLGTETSAKRFDSVTRTWSEIPTMRKERLYGAAATLEGKICVMGGSIDNDSVECFDPESNSWTEMTSMNEPRYAFSAVVINNRLHAL